MKNLLLSFLVFGFFSCGSGGSSPNSGNLDLSGYTVDNANGSSAQKAYKITADGTPIEEGYIVNGAKNGVWMTFHTDNGRVKTLQSYSDNQLNGPSYEFNNRGQIEKESNYLGGKLNGKVVKYKFGRPTVETDYVNGQISGKHIEYTNKGDMQKYVEFKDGVQDGKLRYFDDEGNVTLEYEYKNGEKVGGGMAN